MPIISLRFSFLFVAAFLCATAYAYSQDCTPPPGFVDTPHPVIAPIEQLVSHHEEITIDRPLPVAVNSHANVALKNAIHKAGSLPGVSGVYLLTPPPFGTPGTRRVVCLSDGSTLEEQSLEREQNNNLYRFRYVVWNYTSKQAHSVEYAVGYFYYKDMGDGRTHIDWTYSFKLKDHEFPGYMGSFGRFLFRVGFLDRQYAEMMRGTLQDSKTRAEQQNP